MGVLPARVRDVPIALDRRTPSLTLPLNGGGKPIR